MSESEQPVAPLQAQYVAPPIQTTSSLEQKLPLERTSKEFGIVNKDKSRKGVLIGITVVVIVFVVGIFLVYKLFLSGPSRMTAEIKVAEKNKIIHLEKGGLAPANMFGIMLKDGSDKGDAEEVAKLVNGEIVGNVELNNVYQIEFDGKTKEDLNSALEKVKSSDKVEVAFPDGSLWVDGAENSSCNPFDDTFYDGDDGKAYKMINLKQSWDIIKASGVKLNDVTVGVLDDNVNYESDEISTGDRLIVPLNRSDMEENGELTHGTMVTEVIAANDKNGGMTGVASILGDNLLINTMSNSDNLWSTVVSNVNKDPKDISQIEWPGGYIFTMPALKNLQKQIDKGATIINCSFSNHLHDYTTAENEALSSMFKKFLEKAQAKYPNTIFIGSAGNDNNTQLNGNKIWGKKVDNLVTVGAVDKEGKKTTYTNLATKNGSDEVTVVACGDIKMENGKESGGTSFAAPQVTGLIAMLRSINPKLTPAEIKNILKETSKDVSAGQNFQMNLIQADDAVIKAIESATGKKFDKNKLLTLMSIDLKSEGSSPEFKVSATLESVGENGAVLEIECSGGDYALGGDKRKSLSSSGTVSWSLTIPNNETKISVKVTRLDTKACKVILVGGKLEAKDLVGEWDGGVCHDNWSTPYKMAEEKIREKLISVKGEFLPMKMIMTLISEKELGSKMNAKGSTMPPPPLNFSFNDGNLEASTTHMSTKYNFSGKVKVENGKYQINGEWSGSNTAMKMNGRWKASKDIKQN
jgi:subtilisin family serine protease